MFTFDVVHFELDCYKFLPAYHANPFFLDQFSSFLCVYNMIIFAAENYIRFDIDRNVLYLKFILFRTEFKHIVNIKNLV